MSIIQSFIVSVRTSIYSCFLLRIFSVQLELAERLDCAAHAVGSTTWILSSIAVLTYKAFVLSWKCAQIDCKGLIGDMPC